MQIWIKMSVRRPWGTAGENNVYVAEEQADWEMLNFMAEINNINVQTHLCQVTLNLINPYSGHEPVFCTVLGFSMLPTVTTALTSCGKTLTNTPKTFLLFLIATLT